MLILRNKEFSEDKKQLATLGAGAGLVAVGGANLGKVTGKYLGFKDGYSEVMKKSDAYKTAKAGDEKLAKEFEKAADKAADIRKRMNASPIGLKDKIVKNIKLKKIESSARKDAKEISRISDKIVNRIARSEALKEVAKHNKKNIALAVGGTVAGGALIKKANDKK